MWEQGRKWEGLGRDLPGCHDGTAEHAEASNTYLTTDYPSILGQR